MKRHLFLTGFRHVGKSTIINKLLSDSNLTVGGFRTVRTDTVFAGQPSVHMLRLGEAPAEDNLLFICGERSVDAMARFDALGCAILEESANTQLLLMDELGAMESQAHAFCHAVLSALDGETPILGVLAKADSPFLQQIANHEAVEVVEITKENRDTLPDLLREQFHF